MVLRTMRNVLRRARGLASSPPPGAVSDAALLGRFVCAGDEAAFELLVWRHGPMVWGTCRRVLRYEQDTEDAFQATFLTLARKAAAPVGRRWLRGGRHGPRGIGTPALGYAGDGPEGLTAGPELLPARTARHHKPSGVPILPDALSGAGACFATVCG